ncbi:Xanthine phosphoribosyltransferase 1 [Gryganskiella cystojenkinii]|nr:Xanthine phosphoribosyltransferase 1 [Gryganskiella cystojenkinii]
MAVASKPTRRKYREIREAPPPSTFRERIREVGIGMGIFCIVVNIIIFSNLNTPVEKPIIPSIPVTRRSYNFSNAFSGNGRNSVIRRPDTGSHKRPPSEPLPAWQLDWIARQELDPEDFKDRLQPTMDLIYTWVNGTEPGLRKMKDKFRAQSPLFATPPVTLQAQLPSRRRKDVPPKLPVPTGTDPTANRFRDLDELRFSMRSIAANAGNLFRKIYVLTTEVVEEAEDGTISSYGQTPVWFKRRETGGEGSEETEEIDSRAELVLHKEIYDNTSFLPSFNSLSIESQMHHVPGLADIFVYLNDEFFFGKPLGPADFWTPQYGFVFHFDTATPILTSEPELLKAGETQIGEHPSLRHTNFLLSQHFGSRHRVYLAHIAHINSGPIMDEIQSIWPEEFNKTSSHRFRGEGQAREIQVSYMLAHYVMERHRETLLSSFWKYRLDKNRDGRLDWEERSTLIKIVENYHQIQRKITKNMRYHTWSKSVNGLEAHEKVFETVGIPFSNESKYHVSGRDGYAFMLSNGGDTSKGSMNQPTFRPYHPLTLPTHRTCHFDFDFCLGPAFKNRTLAEFVDGSVTRGGSIFERMAFQEYHCGDCLLHILRQQSYVPGLGHLMPEDEKSKEFLEVATDLAKYNYVVSQSEFRFVGLTNGMNAQQAMDSLMRLKDKITFFCTNDDMPDSPLIVQRVKAIYSNFMNARFPIPSPWEKTN